MYGWEFPPHNSGGLGVACQGLVRALSQAGHDVRFVLPRKFPVNESGARMVYATDAVPLSGALAEKLQSGYITEEQLRILRAEYPELHLGPSLYDDVLTYAGLASMVALAEECDVIHVHDWLTIPAGIAAKRVTGKPLIVHIHATEWDRTGMLGGDSRVHSIEYRGVHEADKVIAVSGYLKQVLVDKYAVDPAKVEVVHNGCEFDDERFATAQYEEMHRLKRDGWKVVLYFGRFTLQKGVDFLLEAAKKVLDREEKVVFVLAGSGDMEHQLIDKAAYLGIGDRVLFTGFIRGAELGRMIRLSDVFVMPSVSEPFGLVAVEAAALGVPVILSKQSGVREVLENSLQVDFWDVDAMAEQILAIVRYPGLRETITPGLLEQARAQVWRQAAAKCIIIYENAVKAASRT